MGEEQQLPRELARLAPRQREIVRVIFNSGGATLREIHAQIPDAPPSLYGIRTLLLRLIDKGLLKVRRSGRHRELLYFVASPCTGVWINAFRRLSRDHFGGSELRALAALGSLAANEAQPAELPASCDGRAQPPIPNKDAPAAVWLKSHAVF